MQDKSVESHTYLHQQSDRYRKLQACHPESNTSENKIIVASFSMKLIKTVLEYKGSNKITKIIIIVSFAYVFSANYLNLFKQCSP